MEQQQRVAEITNHYPETGGQPHFCGSLPEPKYIVLQKDQPGILLPGTDVISSSDPWRQQRSVAREDAVSTSFALV